MTHIVSPTRFPTKKALRDTVKAGTRVYAVDPAVHSPINGDLVQILREVEARGGTEFDVTNHPKRSWYGVITRNAKGELVVK